jgi:signal transduction histidine kinase
MKAPLSPPRRLAAQAIRHRIFVMGAALTVMWSFVLPRFLLLDALAKSAATWTGLATGLSAVGLTLLVISLRLRRGARPHLAFRAASDLAIITSALAILRWRLNQYGNAVPYVESFSILLLDVSTGWLASLGLYVWVRHRLRLLGEMAHLRGLPGIRTVFWISAAVLGGFAAVVLGIGSAARSAGALDRQRGHHLVALSQMMAIALDAAEDATERLHVMHLLDTELHTEAALLPEGDHPPRLPKDATIAASGPFVVIDRGARAHWIRRDTNHGVLWLTAPANVRPPVRAPNDAPAMLILALLVLGAPVAAWSVGQDLREELSEVTRALNAMASGNQGGPVGVPLSSNDEVGDVAAELNAVCARYSAQHELLTADLDAAESSDRARGRFLASASHELRTPLNTVAGFCHLLGGDSTLSPGQREDVRTIAESTEQLLGHVDEILGLSEMGTTNELHWQPVALDAVARGVIERSGPQHGLLLAVTQAPSTPPAWGDLRRLGQVVENLINNAIKFTPSGHVRVHVSATQLDDAPAVALAVNDTGPGIPADELEAVFTEFHRVEAQREVSGTGLGLAIARRISHQHGGTIIAESELGVGSTFTLVVPAWSDD